MQRRAIVFQHVAHEILGTLHPLLKEQNIRIKYVNFARDTNTSVNFEGYQLLIILGGPMSVYDTKNFPFLSKEIEYIRQAIDRGMTVMGICLGSQLIAKAIGGDVFPADQPEIGWYRIELTADGAQDPLFNHFKKSESVFHWHSDTFTLPDEAIQLASSKRCDAQAFSYRDRVYGLQFHLEVDEPLINRWLNLESHQEELDRLRDHTNRSKIESDTILHNPRLQNISSPTFKKLLHLVKR